MADSLAEKSCTPCRGGVPPLTSEEAARYLAQAPQWDLLDDGRKIPTSTSWLRLSRRCRECGRRAGGSSS